MPKVGRVKLKRLGLDDVKRLAEEYLDDPVSVGRMVSTAEIKEMLLTIIHLNIKCNKAEGTINKIRECLDDDPVDMFSITQAINAYKKFDVQKETRSFIEENRNG